MGSGGGAADGSGQLPTRLLCAAAWAVGTEALAMRQYRETANRDAQRRAELFGADNAGRQCERPAASGSPAPAPAVSIIVPALNEEAGIQATLRHLRQQLQPAAAEVIVVDGGSTDGTAAVARRCGARVARSGRGRARQMNAGAALAKGDLLLFCHADTLPPRGAVGLVRREMSRPAVVLGGFRPLIEEGGRRLGFFTANNTMKTYYGPAMLRPLSFLRGLRCLFGDQAIFCRASDFRRVGGYDGRLAIMEDADLCIRLHMAGPAGKPGRRGQVVQVNDVPARSSGRRLASWGSVHATAVHVIIALSWYCGASPQRLRQLYDRLYTDVYR